MYKIIMATAIAAAVSSQGRSKSTLPATPIATNIDEIASER